MKHMIGLSIGLFVFILLATTSPGSIRASSLPPRNSPVPASASAAADYVPGELLVRYKTKVAKALRARTNAAELATGDTTLDAMNRLVGVQRIAPLFQTEQTVPPALRRIYKLQVAADADIPALAAQYAKDPNVQFAEPNYIAHALATPNDPDFGQQWGLTRIAAPLAWDTTTGSTNVVIAIIDSGMQRTHPDLAANLWVNPGEVAGNGLDDDANGHIDDVNGWNFVAGNNNPNDDNGHGTLVAGIAAAATNNGAGVAGVCWICKLMPVKVMNAGGVANYSDIAEGVIYAAEKGAEVINLSLGGSADSATLHAAIQSAANDYNSVVVAGAGNDSSDALFYPAAYAEVLAVAGTDEGDVKVGTSNYGTWVDVSAPGVNIRTTASGGGYATSSGTSLASPFAAGLAGLVRSEHPAWSQALVRAQVIQTAEDIDGLNVGYEGELGSGRIDAANAFSTNGTPLIRFVDYSSDSETNGGIKTGVPVLLSVTLRNDWGDAASVQATLSTTDGAVTITDANANYGALASGDAKTNSSDTFRISVTGGMFGRVIPFTLNLNADGNHSVVNFNAETESAVVNVGGIYTTDQVWTPDREYHLTNDVRFLGPSVLTILPGTKISSDSGHKLQVDHMLSAEGTPSDRIVLTNVFLELFGSTTLRYLHHYGGSPYCLSVQGEGQITIENSLFENCDTGLHVPVTPQNAPSTYTIHIQNNRFQNNGIGLHLFKYDFIALGVVVSIVGSIEFNTFVDNITGILIEGGDYGALEVSHNLVSRNTTGVALGSVNGMMNSSVSHNTIASNGTGLVWRVTGNPIVENNNLYGSKDYNLVYALGGGYSYCACSNWWGTTNISEIEDSIFGLYSQFGQRVFAYEPILLQPDTDAPVVLEEIILNPSSPVGIQSVTFQLAFSGPMNQSVHPAVTFGLGEPFSTFSVVDESEWLDERTWRAIFDITSLVPIGTHTVNVGGAVGLDGIEIPTDTRFSFSVDYAGTITDQTPPIKPKVTDQGGGTTSLTQLYAQWKASDPESLITQFQYAIGTWAGATDVVNWTTPNPATATQVMHTGLNLTAGQAYYFAVRAQNQGGLWSQVGTTDGILADPNFVPLAAPKLKKPAKEAVLITPKVKLKWDAVTGATSYQVIVRQDSKNGKKVFQKDRPKPSAKTPVLTSGKTYYWQTRACTQYGCGNWSKWWSFTIQ